MNKIEPKKGQKQNHMIFKNNFMLKDNKQCFLFSIALNNFASDQSPECSITSPADLQINQTHCPVNPSLPH